MKRKVIEDVRSAAQTVLRLLAPKQDRETITLVIRALVPTCVEDREEYTSGFCAGLTLLGVLDPDPKDGSAKVYPDRLGTNVPAADSTYITNSRQRQEYREKAEAAKPTTLRAYSHLIAQSSADFTLGLITSHIIGGLVLVADETVDELTADCSIMIDFDKVAL